MLRDMRQGICPLCAHQEIIEVIPPEFANGDMERPMALTYKPRWIVAGRNPNHPLGQLRRYACRHCGYTQTFVLDPEEVPIGEDTKTTLVQGPGAQEGTTGRTRLETQHAALYLSDEGLEQDWPSGAVHNISWGERFTVHVHREPDGHWRGPLVEVHLRLQQNRDGHTHMVALTLCLEDQPSLRALEPMRAFLPRLTGEQAQEFVGTLRMVLEHHGDKLPW